MREPENQKKTWLTPYVEKFKKTKLGKVLVQLAVILSFIGGLMAGAEKIGETGKKLYETFLKEDESDYKIKMTIQNSRKTDVDLNSICSFSVQENLFNSSISYGGFGEYLQVYPIKKDGTNSLHIQAGQKKEFYVNLPNTQKAKEVVGRRAASITVNPVVMQGANISGSINLDRGTLRKQNIFMEVK